MNLRFEGIGAFDRFTHFVERLAATQEAPLIAAAEASSHVLYENVLKTFGDASKLETLAPATQASRVARGYAADEPLLEDGTLLRDSVDRLHEGLVAGVGSNEPILAYHEWGYLNARTGTPVPPRPVFEIALRESEDAVNAILEAACGVALGAPPVGSIVLKF